MLTAHGQGAELDEEQRGHKDSAKSGRGKNWREVRFILP